MDNNIAKVAVAATLITTWSVAEASAVNIELETSRALSHAYLASDGWGSGASECVTFMGSFAAGTTVRPVAAPVYAENSHGFIGLAADNGAVIVSFAGTEIPTGSFFDIFGVQDSVIRGYILSGNTLELSAFAAQHSAFLSKKGYEYYKNLSDFSSANLQDIGPIVGQYKLTAVPEPASLIALGCGALATLRRRKK